MSRHRDYRMRRNYGLTTAAADAMIRGAGNKCMICEKPERRKGHRLSIDHCHATGVVRGVLCRSCNLVLGGVMDNPTLLRRAAEYLEKSRTHVPRQSKARTGLRLVRASKPKPTKPVRRVRRDTQRRNQ